MIFGSCIPDATVVAEGFFHVGKKTFGILSRRVQPVRILFRRLSGNSGIDS